MEEMTRIKGNGVDRSIIKISRSVTIIYDRMFELYRTFLPQALEIIHKNIMNNGSFIEETFGEYNSRKTSFMLNSIPFTVLCKLLDESLYNSLMSKIDEIMKDLHPIFAEMKETKDTILNLSNSEQEFMESSVEEFDNLYGYELDFIHLGFNSNFLSNHSGVYRTDLTNLKQHNPYGGPSTINIYNLPIVSIANKNNYKIFNQIFKPVSRFIDGYFPTEINGGEINLNKERSYHKKLEYLNNSSGRVDLLFSYNGNEMIIDIDTFFSAIHELVDWVASCYETSGHKIDNKTNELNFENTCLEMSTYIRTYNFLRIINLIDIVDNVNSDNILSSNSFYEEMMEKMDIHKNIIKASCITTYLCNVSVRLQEFSNSFLDELVNKYMSLSTYDKEINSFKNINANPANVRERAWNFYALFRNVVASSDPGRYQLNWDNSEKGIQNPYNKHLTKIPSPSAFVFYLIKKIYEHEHVTFNSVFNLIHNENSFIMKESEYLMKAALVHVKDREAKLIIQTITDYMGRKSLIGHGDVGEEKNPIFNVMKNHRALASLYKQALVLYVNALECYRNSRSLSSSDDKTKEFYNKYKDNIQGELKTIACHVQNLLQGFWMNNSTEIIKHERISTKLYYKPHLGIALFYNGKWNIEPEYYSEVGLIFNSESKDSNFDDKYYKDFVTFLAAITDTKKNINKRLRELTDSEEYGYVSNNTREGFPSDFEDTYLTSMLNSPILLPNKDASSPRNNISFKSDFGQYDTTIDSCFDSVESFDKELMFKNRKKIKSLESLLEQSKNLVKKGRLSSELDIASIAFHTQLSYLSGNKSEEDLLMIKKIDENLSKVLINRNYDKDIASEEALLSNVSPIKSSLIDEIDMKEIKMLEKVKEYFSINGKCRKEPVSEKEYIKCYALFSKLYKKQFEMSPVVEYYLKNIGPITDSFIQTTGIYPNKTKYIYNDIYDATVEQLEASSSNKFNFPTFFAYLQNFDELGLVVNLKDASVYEWRFPDGNGQMIPLGMRLGEYLYTETMRCYKIKI